jgi:hypothetical protein
MKAKPDVVETLRPVRARRLFYSLHDVCCFAVVCTAVC